MHSLVKEKAQQIIKRFGTGYYRATFLFPRKIREDTWTLYKFVRIPDEIVDVAEDESKKKNELRAWTREWNAVYCGQRQSDDMGLTAMKEIMLRYNIDKTYVDEFLNIMMQDITVSRYQTYDELKKYMYGSASVIGIMMSHIIGFKPEALSHAQALGEAMQLTNFLRDIREDYEVRNRIYMPEDEMKLFKVTEEHMENHICDDAWREFMKFQVGRARELYTYANSGIQYLDKKGRSAIWAASSIYEAILDEIEKQNYDVFIKRATVSPQRKTMLLWKAICKRKK